MSRVTGHYVRSTLSGLPHDAFVPAPLPPQPPLALDNDLAVRRDRALVALGELKGITRVLPDARLFLYQYVRKEALLSSQIEGAQSSLSDLLLYELDQAPGVPLDDVREVSNYIAALEHGLQRMREGFPLSLRLIREMHEHLLRRGAARASHRASSAAHPCGSGEPAPIRRSSCRRRPTSLRNAWVRWSNSCMPPKTAFRRWPALAWPMCSSRPSIPSWTATGGWGVC